jgi:hypothetical protein
MFTQPVKKRPLESFTVWAFTFVHAKNKIKKTGNVHISITLRRVHVTTVAVEKQEVLHILSVSSLSHRARKAHAPFTLSSMACLALTYFSTLSYKRQYARKEVTEYKLCGLITFMFIHCILNNKCLLYTNICTNK